jgi:uncharacterized protein YpuA (DUF1002 family)
MVFMKKIISVALALLLSVTMLSGLALADADQSRLVFGKDLTDKQKQDLLKYFDVQESAVPTLTITIDEEKAYLGKLVSADKIGSRSLSSIYIQAKDVGSGLNVTTKNINWVTADMYTAALTTAGIKDADIKIASPVSVSGTAALAGIYKAYEDITGKPLDSDAKTIASDELALTGNLADFLGSAEATKLVNELKAALDQIKGKSADEVKAMVLQVAKENNVTLTDDQANQLTQLLMKLSQMNIDPATLLDQAKKFQALAEKVNTLQKTASGVGGWIANAWSSVTGWFSSLFGGKK